MDENRRNSGVHEDVYLSLYGNNRKLKPDRIKTYAFYRKLSEGVEVSENFVIASDDTNEISISCNGQFKSKVFEFDKVFCNNVSKSEIFDTLAKHIIQDVIMGLSNFLIVFNLESSSLTKPFDDQISTFEMDSIANLTEIVLKELFLHTKNEENMDSSLHASYFQVHDDKLIDFLRNCHESKDLKIFEVIDPNHIEVQHLTEKPITDEKDIFYLLSKQQTYSSMCYADCSILSISLIKNNVNSNGFEFTKVGNCNVVHFGKLKSKCLVDASKTSEEWLLQFLKNQESPSSKCKIFDILRPAFVGNARTSFAVSLSSVLCSVENLDALQFVSETQKILNYPVIDLHLVIPNSLEEYSEEIQELQEDFNAISKGTGVNIDSQMYRYYKNSKTLEKEKVKMVNNYILSLTDDLNAKNQKLIDLHSLTEMTKCDIKNTEKSNENLRIDLDKMKSENNSLQQKVFMKADEILVMKQIKICNELSIEKAKVQLTKANQNCKELAKSLYSLKSDLASLSCDISAEQTSLRSTFELLIVDMNNTLSDFQLLQADILMKLSNLNEIDIMLNLWKKNMETWLSKFSYFIDETNKNFNSIKVKANSQIPLHTSKNEILEIIRNKGNEKWPVLSYYFHRVQVFCDSSFKILAEVMHQLDVIQGCYKAELKSVGAVLCSSSKAFKNSVSEIELTLKSYQKFFNEQEKELSFMTDMVCFHHNFKKNFDENVAGIKHSLLSLKRMCIGHNDATINKWNEIQKSCYKTTENFVQFSDHLSMIHKEISIYMDNLAQQKLNVFETFPIKTENIESKLHQLLQIYKEMQGVIVEAFEVHKKGTDKELLEVRELVNSQKADVEKYFDAFSLKLKNNSRSFYDELRSIKQTFENSKVELKGSLNSLSSCISDLSTIYSKYKNVSKFILEKSERSFKIMPIIREDKKDNIPDFDCLILDEWKVASSTPKCFEKKVLNLPCEKEKLLCRIKSAVEHQMSQKLSVCGLDLEGKEKKNHNISTMSLPNMSTHLKVYNMTGKNLSKLKLHKKNA